MGSRRLAAIVAVCLFGLFAVRLPWVVDNTASAEKKKTVLEHADTVEGGETTGASGRPEPFRSATGNVVIRQGAVLLTCDHAIDYPESSRINLDGNVHINDDAVESYGDRGIYYTDEEVGELSGNVRGRVIRDNLVARSNKSVFNLKADELWLYDDAIAWHQGRQLSGDIIRVHVREVGGKKKVDEIQVHGNAFFASRDTLSVDKPLYNQLSGQHMVITLDERSKLTGVTVTTGAKSLYHIYNEKNEPSGINYTSGEVIRMFFNDGKLSSVLVTRDALGRQYPDTMRGDKGIDLPGFRWREKETPVFK